MSDKDPGAQKPEENFSTTMRIDITPHLKEQLTQQAAGGASPARRMGRVMIKIPKKPGESAEIGSPDFQEILQNVYDATLITDLNGRIVSVNPRAVQFFRGDRLDLRSQNIIDLISGADPNLVPVIRKNLENDRYTLIQAYCLRSDETIFPAEISANRLHLSGQDYLSFFIRDISWRKEAEERLRTGYTAIQNSGGGIVIADLAGQISFCNPSMSRLLGVEDEGAMHGRGLREFFLDAAQVDEILQSLAEGRAWSGEIEMQRADQTTVCAQGSVAPNLNADDELTGMVLSVLDITGLKQAQTQLEQFAEELQQKNDLLESDQNMAREIQQAFLPRKYPAFPSGSAPEESALRFGHLYFPSGAVGGDFFDLLALSEHHLGIFISDVAGHGMRAALVVATIRGLIEELVSSARDPGVFLTQMNRAYNGIFSQTEQLTFTTAFYMVLDLRTGEMRYTTAGHPLPYLLCRRDNRVAMLPSDGGAKGPALGLFEEASYHTGSAVMAPSDLIFLYTDGLSEVEGPDRELYEDRRLAKTLEANLSTPPDALLPELVADARRYAGREDFEDDVCLLAVEIIRLLPPS